MGACAGRDDARGRVEGGRFDAAATVHGVVTSDEIGRVTVFAGLEPADRERLCRVAADISLAAGGLPPGKDHCSILAAQTLQNPITHYRISHPEP